ncbi:SPOSA6832_01286 [Sporobolomyces salmonicolor]|uniref:ribonuclease H n=1 Tax=Sporidiobolus salmonicolor TaxID=5005 RepID=A0A0D6EIA4_SPOSA|nr:SPOSA6832_01286 [Sporobolomyces salmonicolor]
MAKATKGGYYAGPSPLSPVFRCSRMTSPPSLNPPVRVGRKPGIYMTWDECNAQVLKFAAAKYKKFPTLAEAQAFVEGADAQVRSAVANPASPPLDRVGMEHGKRKEVESDVPTAKRQKRGEADAAPKRAVDPVFGASSRGAGKGREVWCDGSSRGNGKKSATAGIGVFWSHEVGASNLSERLPGKLQTNNRAEMYASRHSAAVARILETDPHPELPLTICTDSEYTIGVFSKWLSSWLRRGWKTSQNKPVMNKDLILYVLSLLSLRTPSDAGPSAPAMANVTFRKVKAHVGIEGNEMADRLANNGALMPVAEDRDFEKLAKENENKLRERRGASISSIEDARWGVEVEEGDLLTQEDLTALEQKQDF